MQVKVKKLLKFKSPEKKDFDYEGHHGNSIKFMVYSAHDTQIDNMMVFLTQNKTSFDYVPYTSQVIFELKYSEECMQSSNVGKHCLT